MGKKRKVRSPHTVNTVIDKLNWLPDSVAASKLAYDINDQSQFNDKVKLNNRWKHYKTIDSASGIRAKIWIDDTSGDILTSYRGTSSIKELKIDASLGTAPFKTGNGETRGNVYRGFGNAFSEIEPYLSSELKFLKNADYQGTISFTGHSLGAAMSDLSSTYYSTLYPDREFINTTLASPSVGDATYANYARTQPNVFRTRIVCPGDPIANIKLPGTEFTEKDKVIELIPHTTKKQKLTSSMMKVLTFAQPSLALALLGKETVDAHGINAYEENIGQANALIGNDGTDISMINNGNVDDIDDIYDQAETNYAVGQEQSSYSPTLQDCACECHAHDQAINTGDIPPPSLGAIPAIAQPDQSQVLTVNSAAQPAAQAVDSVSNQPTFQSPADQTLASAVESASAASSAPPSDLMNAINAALQQQVSKEQNNTSSLQAALTQVQKGVKDASTLEPYQVDMQNQQIDLDNMNYITNQIQLETQHPELLTAGSDGYDGALKLQQNLKNLYNTVMTAAQQYDTGMAGGPLSDEQTSQVFNTQTAATIAKNMTSGGTTNVDYSNLSGNGPLIDTTSILNSINNQASGNPDNVSFQVQQQYVGEEYAGSGDVSSHGNGTVTQSLTNLQTGSNLAQANINQNNLIQGIDYNQGTAGPDQSLHQVTDYNAGNGGKNWTLDNTQLQSQLDASANQHHGATIDVGVAAGTKENIYTGTGTTGGQEQILDLLRSGMSPNDVYNQMKGQLVDDYTSSRTPQLQTMLQQDSNAQQQHANDALNDQQNTDPAIDANRQTFMTSIAQNNQFQQMYQTGQINLNAIVNAYTTPASENQLMTSILGYDPTQAQASAASQFQDSIIHIQAQNLAPDKNLAAIQQVNQAYSIMESNPWLSAFPQQEQQHYINSLLQSTGGDQTQIDQNIQSLSEQYNKNLLSSSTYGYGATGNNGSNTGVSNLNTTLLNQAAISMQGVAESQVKDGTGNQQIDQQFSSLANDPTKLKDYFNATSDPNPSGGILGVLGDALFGAVAGGKVGGVVGATAGGLSELIGGLMNYHGLSNAGYYDSNGNYLGYNTTPGFSSWLSDNPGVAGITHETYTPSQYNPVQLLDAVGGVAGLPTPDQVGNTLDSIFNPNQTPTNNNTEGIINANDLLDYELMSGGGYGALINSGVSSLANHLKGAAKPQSSPSVQGETWLSTSHMSDIQNNVQAMVRNAGSVYSGQMNNLRNFTQSAFPRAYGYQPIQEDNAIPSNTSQSIQNPVSSLSSLWNRGQGFTNLDHVSEEMTNHNPGLLPNNDEWL